MRSFKFLWNCTFLISFFVAASATAQDIPFDCINARELVNKNSVTVAGSSFGAVGAFDESGSCFTGAERSPYWFTFEVCKSGTLSAFVDPEGTVADFDFVLYDVTDGCGSKLQVACNAITSGASNNITGIGCTNGSSCQGVVNVTKDRRYAIMFVRYTAGSTVGFTLTLGGSCEFFNPNAATPPSIVAPTRVCGLTTNLSSISNGAVNQLWTGSGPGSFVFSQETEPSTAVTVGAPGIYKFYYTETRLVCGSTSVQLSDTVEIEFVQEISVFDQSSFVICESSDEVNFQDHITAGVPLTGTWSNASGSGIIDTNGVFFPNNLGGNSYTFSYNLPPNDQCYKSPSAVTVTVTDELQVVTDSVRCFNAGANYRVFTHISGGLTGTYTVNGTPINSAFYSSSFLPNNFNYNFTFSDNSQCPAVTISGVKDCSCSTDAGSLDPNASLDCNTQTISVSQNVSPSLDNDDISGYALYSDVSDPKGSILLQSSSPDFTFQSPLTADTDYYISAIAGSNNGSGAIDLSDPCLNFSSAVKVRFPGPSLITIQADTLICEGQAATLHFTVSGQSDAKVTFSSSSNPVDLFLSPGTTDVSVAPTSAQTYQIITAKDEYGCSIPFSGNGIVNVTTRPSFSYSLPGDSVVCVGQPQGNPVLVFNVGTNDTVTVYYTVNGIPQQPLSNVSDVSTLSLAQTSNGKNTFQVYKLVSQVTGCTYELKYPELNYYFLNPPVVSISADDLEFCDKLGSVNVTFNYTENLRGTVYYNISGVRLSESVVAPTTRNYPVTTDLVFNLDSLTYPQFPGCTFPLTGNVTIKQYSDPTLVFETLPITCVDPTGSVVIHSSNLSALYNVENTTFKTDTIYEFTTPGIKAVVVKLGDNCLYNHGFPISKIDPFTITTTATDTKCAKDNGSFITSLNGSFVTPVDIKYNGQPISNNLPAGPYVIVVTDATGCTVSKLDTIEDSQPFVITANALDTAKCVAGTKGSVVMTASGGDGTIFTYSSDGVNFGGKDTLKNLDPRFYTVYARNDKGCIDSVKVKVKSDTNLVVVLDVDKTLDCYESTDAVVNILVTNSTANLTYSADGFNYFTSNTITGLNSGQKVFYAREGSGCKREASTTFLITRPDPIKLTLLSKGNPSCFNIKNGFVIMKADGSNNVNYIYTVNNGINYQANGAFSGLSGGVYQLFAKNAFGCSSDTIEVTLVDPPAILINVVDMTLNPDGITGNVVIHANGGFAPLKYSVDGTNYFADSTFNNLPKGTYTVYVKDDKGCIETRSVLVGGVGIGELSAQTLNAYPNPFTSLLTLTNSGVASVNIQVSNALGQIIYTNEMTSRIDIETSNWSSGVYFITLNDQKETITLKVIKE